MRTRQHHVHSHPGCRPCSHNTQWASGEPRRASAATRCTPRFPWTAGRVSPLLLLHRGLLLLLLLWGLSSSKPQAFHKAYYYCCCCCTFCAQLWWCFLGGCAVGVFFSFLLFSLWLSWGRVCNCALWLLSWQQQQQQLKRRRNKKMCSGFVLVWFWRCCEFLGYTVWGVNVIREERVLGLSNGDSRVCHLMVLVTTEMPLSFLL